MKIAVNNGRFVEIEKSSYGIMVTHYSADGSIESRDGYNEDEIIMVINLLEYMKCGDHKSVYLMDESTTRYCDNLIKNGDLEEFKIFQ